MDELFSFKYLVSESRILSHRLLGAVLGQHSDHLEADACYVAVVAGLVKLRVTVRLASVRVARVHQFDPVDDRKVLALEVIVQFLK